MGRLDNSPENIKPENFEPEDSNTAENLVKAVTHDLRNLQQDLVAQLHQDIRRLQAEKSRLLNDVEKLQNQQQVLQSQYEVSLSRQQLAQQQAWAKQLALALANHLHTALNQRLSQTIGAYPVEGVANLPQISAASSENTQRLLASLDDTVNRTFDSLRHDLSSYESTISQQLSRMHDLGRQGEAILDVLVGRLSQQLQSELGKSQSPDRPPDSIPPTALPDSALAGYASVAVSPTANYPNYPLTGHSASGGTYPPAGTGYSPRTEPPSQVAPTILPTAPAVAPEPAIAPMRPFVRSGQFSNFQLGLVMILFSTLALSLHNVVVGIVGTPNRLFGALPIGGYINLSFDTALLILWMRMLVVVPLMAWMAGVLYKPAWRDVKTFFQSKDRRLLWSVTGSGFFLFLSQILIYIAIGQIGPGIAVTILFMYPLVTVPLAWLLFGDRPTRLRVIVMVAIVLGVALTKFAAPTSLSWLGVMAAIVSGITFALYLISMQISFRKLHPVPVSLIQFTTIFIFTSVSLIVMGVEVQPINRTGLIISGLILGGLTLIGYLLNNFGVRFMGAARASIMAASGPAITALLAVLIIPGPFTALHQIQILGILIVTMGVTALSFERMLIHNRVAARQAKAGNS
ncbi:MAG: EamA family transporter [Cyanobacteria bacterium CRU_2_1]|nr:EamA family transporter [Cyanobacteria bacterium RU_5_0]NJR59511.1 EamA family transporter [Cyanobacteria bacterium CRU_2_1]